ncbi:plasmid stabilization protein [Herbaspirillum sp. WKF16]|jgi:plasmid stabilization system protein ParE|uniref:plasmid stabilization protein n=1 Tax=Herbaspirillum sp. WKF16 TaxID=3028312 RepID=UPI0023A986FE|nr:plasmid stabilization protein [Herbaspirillum sp. WKF16]WDZ95026.1 plasmid stabilization protein [Herbaspirillum sp. WKF16]
MPQTAWSNKRERQYEHIKSGAIKRGTNEKRAEEIAARTVNKERAQHGEARKSTKSLAEDMSPSRRGGLRSHKGSGGRTYQQLYAEASFRNIKGRSSMNKAELEKVLGRH